MAIFFFGLIGGAIGYFALKGRNPRRADHVLKWGLIITAVSIAIWVVFWLVLLAIVAHSASSNAAQFTPYTDAATTAAFTTPTTTIAPRPSVSLGQPVVERTVTGETQDGYSASADVTVYRPFHADRLPALPLSSRSTLADCTVDGTQDATIPISIVLTNTTSSFSTVLGFNMTADTSSYSGDSYNVSVEGDLQLSDGVYCDGPQTRDDGDVYSVIWNDATAPNASVSSDFFLIVHNFYSPNYPHGDPSLLRSLRLAPTFQFGQQGSQTTAGAAEEIPIH